MIATILSKYLVGIGTTVTMAGFIVGLVSLTSLVCRPFSGLMADRFSNVTLLKWSTVLMGCGLLGFTITTQVPLLIFFVHQRSRFCPGRDMSDRVGNAFYP